jgi:two-component system, cell cycle sensor histidine kinase and response regulator CckA
MNDSRETENQGAGAMTIVGKDSGADDGRLESVAALAARLSHDFNNIVSAIVGHAFLLRSGQDLPEGSRSSIEAIEQACDRAQALTRQLQVFARGGSSSRQLFDLNATVRAVTVGLASRGAGAPRVDLDLDPHLPSIWGDPGQLGEMFARLCENAREATAGAAGVIQISSRVDPDIEGWVRLFVEDTGRGIPDGVRARMFEPFFTTKSSKTAGLGLSYAYGVVRGHGGTIEAQNRPEGGARFVIRLPISGRVPLSRSATPRPPAPAPSAVSRSVLVVDDDPDSLRVLGNVLESGGYQPLLASGGEEGLRVIRERPSGFGVVVLDVQMPDLSGPEVYRRARDQGMEVPVIFVTGYADDLTRRILAEVAPEAPLVPKPIVVPVFLTEVGRLAGHGAGPAKG